MRKIGMGLVVALALGFGMPGVAKASDDVKIINMTVNAQPDVKISNIDAKRLKTTKVKIKGTESGTVDVLKTMRFPTSSNDYLNISDMQDQVRRLISTETSYANLLIIHQKGNNGEVKHIKRPLLEAIAKRLTGKSFEQLIAEQEEGSLKKFLLQQMKPADDKNHLFTVEVPSITFADHNVESTSIKIKSNINFGNEVSKEINFEDQSYKAIAKAEEWNIWFGFKNGFLHFADWLVTEVPQKLCYVLEQANVGGITGIAEKMCKVATWVGEKIKGFVGWVLNDVLGFEFTDKDEKSYNVSDIEKFNALPGELEIYNFKGIKPGTYDFDFGLLVTGGHGEQHFDLTDLHFEENGRYIILLKTN